MQRGCRTGPPRLTHLAACSAVSTPFLQHPDTAKLDCNAGQVHQLYPTTITMASWRVSNHQNKVRYAQSTIKAPQQALITSHLSSTTSGRSCPSTFPQPPASRARARAIGLRRVDPWHPCRSVLLPVIVARIRQARRGGVPSTSRRTRFVCRVLDDRLPRERVCRQGEIVPTTAMSQKSLGSAFPRRVDQGSLWYVCYD